MSPICENIKFGREDSTVAFRFEPASNTAAKLSSLDVETYFAFNASHPRPSGEAVHLRHIFRLYVARAFSKTG